MSRARFSSHRPRRGGTFRPQVEVLEHRLAPGSLHGMAHPPLNDNGDDDRPGQERENDDARMAASRTTSPVLALADGSVKGSSTLSRTDHSVRIHLKTTGLVPGGAYTAWWVVIETPGATPKVGRATGFVAGPNGKVNLQAELNEEEILL